MMLRPDAVVSSVTEVTPDFLHALGVRAVLVDLDDTLLAAGSDLLEPLFRVWLESLNVAQIPVAILSNGAHARVARWAAELGLEGLPLTGKPRGHAFRRGLDKLGTPARETAMVGDQLFTDVLGANRAGIVSVLVTPLSPGKLPHTRVLRRLETLLLQRFARRGGGSAKFDLPVYLGPWCLASWRLTSRWFTPWCLGAPEPGGAAWPSYR